MATLHRTIFAALTYWVWVFTVAFALGVARTLWLAPRIGDLAAVACEVPLTLAVSWWAARTVIGRWRITAPSDAVVIGLQAFTVLMAAELLLARMLAGQSAHEWLLALLTPAGALGLTGQVLFALMPWAVLRRR